VLFHVKFICSDVILVCGLIIKTLWNKKLEDYCLINCRRNEQQWWIRSWRRGRWRTNSRGRSARSRGGCPSGDARRSLLHLCVLLLGCALLPISVQAALLLSSGGSRARSAVRWQWSSHGGDADDHPPAARQDARGRRHNIHAVSNWSYR